MNLSIKNGPHQWIAGPVRLMWKSEGAPVATSGRKSIPAQKDGDDVVLILPDMEPYAGLEISIQDGNPCDKTMRISDSGKGTVDIICSGKKIAGYHYGGNVVRPYINPIVGPYGKSVLRPPASEGNPENIDHKHHRGIWVAHGDTNGVDNWSEEPGHGWTVHQEFTESLEGPVFAKISTRNFWFDNARNRKILEEYRTIIFYNIGTEERIIDHFICLKATEGEVVFRDTKESGLLSVRVMPSMEVDKGGTFENSYGGINEAECWGKRANWCDYYGNVDGKIVGIAVFDQPSNFRYPTWWHIRNYGLMTANFFGLSDFTGDKKISGTYILPAYEQLKLHYRIFVHAGTTSEARTPLRYLNFLNPPEIVKAQ